VDLTVYPKTRIARLPRPLQIPAVIARNAFRRRKSYPYESDGMATMFLSPFLEDKEFDDLYWKVEEHWFPNWHADLRWRVWMLTRLARQAQRLPGNFAEFGVFRGGTAYMTMAMTEPAPDRRMYLFDTFSGTPTEGLTDTEAAEGIGRKQWKYEETSPEYVADFLDPWRSQIEICAGDVGVTLEETETGKLAFAHLDLNASAPTVIAMDYVYPRLLPGAIMAFDDYGDPKYRDQRAAIDEFFSTRPEEPVALPTGQAFVIRYAE
jgi:O-methyltransferase